MEYVINNLSELQTFASSLARDMRAGEVYGFSGDLGAGKTTLIQDIGRSLGILVPMTSPTFVFRKEYVVGSEKSNGKWIVKSDSIKKLVHIDAYRIENGNAEDLGEIQELDAVTLIEWPEKISHILPSGAKKITISILPDESRKITTSWD